MVLMRIFVNALVLLVISILPDIYFVEPTILRILFVALIFGILNAYVKPIVQFLTLRYIFITYGFALVIINAIMLFILNIIVSGMFSVDSFLWAFIGGALIGLVSAILENLFGMQIPIFPEDAGPQPELIADPSTPFERKIVSEAHGPDEGLAAEIPLTKEAQNAADNTETSRRGQDR
jgi:putative membrane protein